MGMKKWLTLREAAEVLGVHPATLRAWADAGEVPSFRTPGGHRRFAFEDLEAFIEKRSRKSALPAHVAPGPIMQRALRQVRGQISKSASGAPWYTAFDEQTRERKRREGRLLFSLALQYVSKPEERERILARARELGKTYGEDSVQFGVSLSDTLRAIFFFRQALLDTLEAGGDMENGQSPADFRVSRGVEEFIKEVIYATVDAYEEELRKLIA